MRDPLFVNYTGKYPAAPFIINFNYCLVVMYPLLVNAALFRCLLCHCESILVLVAIFLYYNIYIIIL